MAFLYERRKRAIYLEPELQDRSMGTDRTVAPNNVRLRAYAVYLNAAARCKKVTHTSRSRAHTRSPIIFTSPSSEHPFIHFLFKHMRCVCVCVGSSRPFSWVIIRRDSSLFASSRVFFVVICAAAFGSAGCDMLCLIHQHQYPTPYTHTTLAHTHTYTRRSHGQPTRHRSHTYCPSSTHPHSRGIRAFYIYGISRRAWRCSASSL